MMVLAWTRSMGGVYPVLWFTALPAKGEGDPGTLNRIAQSDRLTPDQEAIIDSLPGDVSKTDTAANFYPYRDPDPVDTASKVVIVTEVEQIITNVSEVV
jgi:hypothetical protein